MATTLPSVESFASTGDPEWDRVIEGVTAIAAGDVDRTITPEDARRLIERIGMLQLWALERLASDFAEAVYPA